MEAVRLLERAADVLEGLRANLRDVNLQIGALVTAQSVYAQLLDHALRISADPAQALRVIERAKSRTLLDSLAEDDVPPTSLEDPAARAQARELRVAIVREMRRQLVDGTDDEGRRRLEQLRVRLSAIYRVEYRVEARRPNPGATPQEMRQLAAPARAILHYFCNSQRIFVAPVVAGLIRPVVELPGISPERIRALVPIFGQAGASWRALDRNLRPAGAPTDSGLESLKELYRYLIAPLECDLDGVERLLIIPHDVLHTVPFHALARADGRYLLEDFTIAYAPSASVPLP